MLIRTAFAALLLLPTLASCGSDKTEPKADPASETCMYSEDGVPAREVKLPPSKPAYDGDVAVTMKTTVGDLHLTLDAKNAPCAVNSFVSLAKQGFYDKTPCPRLASVATFGLLQCGDPTGTTSGGPGYAFGDELTGLETYQAGTLAMANAGPNTNGSQFFLVFNDSSLSPDYTVFGHIDAAGIKLLKSVGAKGDDGSNPAGGGKPKQPVDISSIVVG